MGIIHVTVSLSDLGKQGTPYEDDFLVDTGAIDCRASADALLAAGIRPEGKAIYELANGDPVEYEYGFARVAFMGEETVAQVVFGPSDAEPLLGVVALENTGVMVDPITRRPKRIHARPLK
jgi:clan AA aspartic protease